MNGKNRINIKIGTNVNIVLKEDQRRACKINCVSSPVTPVTMLDQTDPNLKLSPLNISKPLWKKKKVTNEIKQPKKKPKVKPIYPQCSICNKMSNKIAITKLDEAPVCFACIYLFKKRFPIRERIGSRAVLYTQFKNEYHEDMKRFGFYDIEKYDIKNTPSNQQKEEIINHGEIDDTRTT